MPTPKWIGPTDQLIEMPDSPTYTLGRDPACTRAYLGTHEMAMAGALPRGTYGTMAMAGWIVQKSTINRQRGGIGKLTVIWGASGSASGQQLPPDEVGLAPFEVNPAIEKNKRYSSLNDADFAKVADAYSAFSKKDGTNTIPLAGMLLDLFNKKKRGTTHFYLAGFKYSWTRSFYLLVGVVNVGGYSQAPLGPLASFIPNTFDCVRTADDLKWTGTMYTYTCAWLCGPAGHFDPDLYTPS